MFSNDHINNLCPACADQRFHRQCLKRSQPLPMGSIVGTNAQQAIETAATLPSGPFATLGAHPQAPTLAIPSVVILTFA